MMKIVATDELVRSWQGFYRDFFEINTDFSNLRIPAHHQGFDRLIIVAQGIYPEQLYHKCRESFFGWKSTNDSLDKVVQSDRSSKNGTYAIWFRETIEADEDLKNLSAEELKAQGIPCITLEERLLYELKYFDETDGGHLDLDNVTLCSGSRYIDGYVPTVRYRATAMGLGIHWYKTNDRFISVRARRGVL
jgi:hypothetical protein